jgi:proline-specific peptidase
VPDSSEGRIEVEDGYSIWYKVVGGGDGTPLLTLHGGPGSGHDYLDSMEDLAVDRPVVFYDQLGCGRSDQPDDPERWVIDRFTREIDTVRAALGLDRIHLFGQSWGGWLAIEYMSGSSEGITSLILASTSASIAEFSNECALLRTALPPDVRDALARHEAIGDFEAPEYQAAAGEFYTRHLCRLATWPDSLADIAVSTLITCGRFDEVSPNCAATLEAGIPDSRSVVFEQSAHVAHIEERELYMQVAGDAAWTESFRRGV